MLEERIRQVLQRSRERGITISSKKLDIGDSISFAGHVVSADGVSPHPDKMAALAEFPTPRDRTGVRSFLGLANQLGPFLPDLAAATAGLRQLLKTKGVFSWEKEHQLDFERARRLLATSPLLIKPFDARLSTELLTLHGSSALVTFSYSAGKAGRSA